MLTTPQAGAALSLNYRSVVWLINHGLLQATKIDGRWYIHPDEVARYAKERRPMGRPKKAHG